MKKTIIAGAAATVLAAMPVMGAFAETTITDNFTIKVAETCALGTDNGGNTAGQSYQKENANPGSLIEWTDQSTVLDINCNAAAGYKITPTFGGLTDSDISTTIPYSATTATAGSNTWSASYTKHSGNNDTNGNFSADKTPVTGDSTTTDYYTITYKVGLDVNQKAGTYSGTAKYELAVNS